MFKGMTLYTIGLFSASVFAFPTTLMVSQRKINTMRDPGISYGKEGGYSQIQNLDPINFEDFFKESRIPIIIRTTFHTGKSDDASTISPSETSMQPHHGLESGTYIVHPENKHGPRYRKQKKSSRWSTSPSEMQYEDVPLEKEVKRSMDRLKNKEREASQEKPIYTKKLREPSHLPRFVLIISIAVVAGVVGYYVGKSRESQSYVRIPTNN